MNFITNNFGFYRLVLSLVLTISISCPAHDGSAATSILATLLDKSKSIVSIKSEVGGVFSDKPHAFIHKESGSVIVQKKVAPLYYALTGAGVIIDKQGLIATNAHLVFPGARITVTLAGGFSVPAKLVYRSNEYDIALIMIIPPHPLTSLELSDSNQIALNDRVYSIGASLLLKNTISEGRISGIGVKRKVEGYGNQPVQLIQIDFDLYHGDSGSPLFDKNGQLLGIMSARSKETSKETYAVPANMVLKIIREAAEQDKMDFTSE